MGCNAPTPGNSGVMSDCTLHIPAGHTQSPLPRDPERIPGDGLCLGWRKELPSHTRLWGRQAHCLAKKQFLPWQHDSHLGKVTFRLYPGEEAFLHCHNH